MQSPGSAPFRRVERYQTGGGGRTSLRLVGVGVLVLVVGFVLISQLRQESSLAIAESGIVKPPAAPPPFRIVDIATRSDIDIAAGELQSFDWEVLPAQSRCHLTGRVEVVSGGSRDVQIFVVSDDELKNLANGHSFKSFLSTDKITVANLDLTIGQRGSMGPCGIEQVLGLHGKRVEFRGVKASCR
jgi:hypothetical protein